MRLQVQRKQLLEHLVIKYLNMDSLKHLTDGINMLPYFQLVLTLMSDLSANDEKDKCLLNTIIHRLLALISDLDDDTILTRTPTNEIKLMTIKTIIIILSKSKFQKDSTSFIVRTLIAALNQFNIVDICLKLLKSVYNEYWSKRVPSSDTVAPATSTTPLPSSSSKIVNGYLVKYNDEVKYIDDMSPYFSKENSLVSTTTTSIFDSYVDILTELIIRIPYQLKKQQIHIQFANLTDWTAHLCQYLLLPLGTSPSQANLNRLIKKLLQVLCNNSKESYRKLRDTHIIGHSVNQIVHMCPLDSAAAAGNSTINFINYNYLNANLIFTYDKCIRLVDNLKILFDISSNRTVNWQQYCLDNKTIVVYLIEISLIIDEYIVPVILQLLLCAFGGPRSAQKIQNMANNNNNSNKSTTTTTTAKTKDFATTARQQPSSNKHEEHLGIYLTNYLFGQTVDRHLLIKFIRAHLLETTNVNIRWLFHSLLYTIYKNTSSANQMHLLDLIGHFW
jgi:E3 ubiquitin-protein ligase UBR4